MYSMIDLFGTYAGAVRDMRPWLAGVKFNRDGNLRMQYLAALGLNRDDSDAIWNNMLRYKRWPNALFTGGHARIASMKLAIGQ